MKNIILLAMVLCCSGVKAEPVVIYDSGKTVPGDKYKNFFSTDIKPSFIKDGWVFNGEPEPDVLPEKPESTLAFPVKTTKLTPGRIERSRDQYIATLPGPMCIVGSDPLSKQWITRNYKHLRAANVMCVIVQAENEAQARELAMMLNGMLVNLGDGDVLADYFKIKHYPVLITERSISQ